MSTVLRVPGAGTGDRDVLRFERRTASNGKADALMVKARVLVEQKSLGVDLDKPEPRQGELKTPVRQALDYANSLPPSERPSVLIVCDFNTFRLYDLETDPLARTFQSSFTLAGLPSHVGELAGLFGDGHSRLRHEERMSVAAGRLIADLHRELCLDWLAATTGKPRDTWETMPHPPAPDGDAADRLAWLTVRLAFCLYADSAGLFKATRHPFRDLIDGSTDVADDLARLFDILDTPEDRRDFPPARLARFPYVDGGLFSERFRIPPLSQASRERLDKAFDFDWSGISPVVFGSLMEETLSHDERRAGGMHYTSVRNIHRVINPLFLDDLKAQLDEAEGKPVEGGVRTKALIALQDRLASLRFLDPACGSGNFLTETYLELRRLENRILRDLRNDGQLQFDYGDDYTPIKIRLSSFAGIEINSFACAVAKTALWIAEQQMLSDAGSTLSGYPRFPFTESATIIQGNALRVDWNDVMPGEDCDYVIGNPPFIGHASKTSEQGDDLQRVWNTRVSRRDLDYVTAWYHKAADYLEPRRGSFAFVSTNSITQGIQPRLLFPYLTVKGWGISFAYRSFLWDAQSTDNAGVAVVIIGMTGVAKTTHAIHEARPKGTDRRIPASTINGYLIDGPDLYVTPRSQKTGPLSPTLSRVGFGSMPLDGGNLLLNTVDEYREAVNDPIAKRFVRPFRGSKELIDGSDRWCLWLNGATPAELNRSRYLKKRIEAVRDSRLKSTRAATRTNAATPWLFGENHQPDDNYLAIPRVFSERRDFATCDWLSGEVIAGDAVFTCLDPTGINFALIESSMFMAWQKHIGGRLEGRCRFSNTLVWNTFPLTVTDDSDVAAIIEAGMNILHVRSGIQGSLAEMYNPLTMPPDLRKAHQRLDSLIDGICGLNNATEETRFEYLFDQYGRTRKETMKKKLYGIIAKKTEDPTPRDYRVLAFSLEEARAIVEHEIGPIIEVDDTVDDNPVFTDDLILQGSKGIVSCTTTRIITY